MPDQPRRMSVADLLAEWEKLFFRLDRHWQQQFLASPVAQQIARDHDPDRVRSALLQAGRKLDAVLSLLEQSSLQPEPPKPPRMISRKGVRWTRKEDNYLREAWVDHTPVEEIARSLARTVVAVEYRLALLRLVKDRSDIYTRGENRDDGTSAPHTEAEREGWGGHWDDAPFRPEDLWPDEDYEEVEEPDEYPPGGFIETLRGSAFDVELRGHREED